MNRKRFALNLRFFSRYSLYPLISVIVALCVCITTPLQSYAFSWADLFLQGVQLVQLSNISSTQEVELGKQMNQQLLSSGTHLYRNPEVNRYVQEIGKRLVAYSDRPNLPYTFQIVENDSINAFATLGGFVYVHTGLLKAADNEAQVASVIGHEMGHIGGKHLIKQMKQIAIENGLLTASGLDRSTVVQLGVQLVRNLPLSRQNEFEADQRGLRTLTRSDYAQSEMVLFMQKLLTKSSSTPAFLSTHPATGERIRALKTSINAHPSRGSYGLDRAAYKAKMQALMAKKEQGNSDT
jgi:predicted Zn-dependent protease